MGNIYIYLMEFTWAEIPISFRTRVHMSMGLGQDRQKRNKNVICKNSEMLKLSITPLVICYMIRVFLRFYACDFLSSHPDLTFITVLFMWRPKLFFSTRWKPNSEKCSCQSCKHCFWAGDLVPSFLCRLCFHCIFFLNRWYKSCTRFIGMCL